MLMTAQPKADERLLQPFTILTKAAGAACNMRCDYCYYLEKKELYQKPSEKGQKMSERTLELFIKQYLEAQPSGEVIFCWHGGEALLRPLSFYRKALELQQRYRRADQRVLNTLQTNGLLVTEEWCRFFRDHGFLVGISLDGYKEQHDTYRQTTGQQGSFERVMRAIRLFQKHGVEFNVLSTINAYNASDAVGYYRFLKGIGVKFIQFTPIVERIRLEGEQRAFVEAPDLSSENVELFISSDTRMAPYSLTPEAWGDFTTELYDEWIREDVGEIFVQLFDATLAGWMGVQPGVCSLAETCGNAGAIEFNGDVYSCDHYVYPRHLLGNIHAQELGVMMRTQKQRLFGLAKKERLTEQCKGCSYLFACHGECPKNRFAYSVDHEAGHNYLCRGYYRFFEHVTPTMDYMKQLLLEGRPPSLVMQWLASQ